MKEFQSGNETSPSFCLLTFGCQMNVRDSQWLTSALTQRGFKESPLDEADLVILNTCSVREKPEQKIISTVHRIVRERNGKVRIAILGCVAQQMGRFLLELAPQVICVAGGDSLALVPDGLAYLCAHPKEKLALLDFSPNFTEKPGLAMPVPSRSAFVNIMQGCDNFCSYCIVPFTRGRQRSREIAAIMAECEEWLEQGAVEITLLGQNVNAWGLDLPNCKQDFSDLLAQIATLPGLKRLRFVTSHPKDLTEQTINSFAQLKALCPRLHLPLQAGSNRILTAMRRGHSQEQFLELLNKLRKARPDLALSTDLIAGFPGETEEDFQQTLFMLQECEFMSSFSFCYSERPGTAASALPDKIAPEIKLDRLQRLQAKQEELTGKWLKNRVGQQAEVLVEGASPRNGIGWWQGKDEYGASVNFPGSGELTGKIIDLVITEAKKHSLLGKPQSPL